MTEFDLAVGCAVERNPNYWDSDAVKLDKVVWRVITDGSAALNAYQAGEIDRVNLSSTDVALFTSDPEFGTYSDFRNYYMQFDTQSPNMNVNLRKAVSLAIDRDILAYGVLGTGAAPAGGVVSVGIYGNTEKTFRELNGPVSRFDPDLAKEFWAKGIEELGAEPKLTMLTATGPDFDDMAVFIQDQLRTNLGIEVTINAMTQKARSDTMNAQHYDFALSAWGADYDDAMTYLELWTSTSGYRGYYGKQEYIDLVTSALLEPDPAARLQYMLDAEKMLIEEDMAITGLYDRGFSYLQRPYVKDLIFWPVGTPVEVKYADIVK
jgi:oligopeptide transport system substrate-binding protein